MNLIKTLEQVGRVKVKSVTDNLFYYSLFVLALAVFAAIFKVDNWIIILLFSIAGLFGLIGIGCYFYFMIKNPDYLRSEVFQINKKSIEMLGDKDNYENPNIKGLIHISSSMSSPYSTRVSNEGEGREIKLDE